MISQFRTLYWALRAITQANPTLTRLLENVRLNYVSKTDRLLKLMLSKVAQGEVVYDVGAYIGSYSCAIAKKIEDSLIYSFEPNPDSYAKLIHNISLMKLEGRIIPKQVALGSGMGKRTFHVSSTSVRSSLHDYNARFDDNSITKTLPVDYSNIDYLVESGFCKPPDAMKIDVQGHECEVLRGAKNTIASKSPQIFIEPHTIPGGGTNEMHIREFLSQLGYNSQSLGYPIWFYKEA